MSQREKINIVPFGSISDANLRLKLERLGKLFKRSTKTTPDYFIRAPGRVNLIGDHVDYHEFPVLPMAIQKNVWLVCSFYPKRENLEGLLGISRGSDKSDSLKIYNEDDAIFFPFASDHSLSYGNTLDPVEDWYAYILCGYHGVLANRLLGVKSKDTLEHAKIATSAASGEDDLAKLLDTSMLISSDLPSDSGLSSSSALVCASAVATHLLLSESMMTERLALDLDSRQIAEDCSYYEHLIGTRGGGMDQAVIMTAHEGFAKQIEFYPHLSCTDVRLPDGLHWLVALSGVYYPKAATIGYNTRVMETKLGASLIAKFMAANGSPQLPIDKSITLGRVHRTYFMGRTADEVASLMDRVFVQDPASLDEISESLEIPLDELPEKFGFSNRMLEDLGDSKLELRVRCEHVFEEAERVRKFVHICQSEPENHQALGKLMTESHASLRDKYRCSHKKVDKLVETALDSGALGARVTGAGWGGCIVALVEDESLHRVFPALYDISEFVFKTQPHSGCSVVKAN